MDRRDKLGGTVVADRCSLLDLLVAAPIPVKLLGIGCAILACSLLWMRTPPLTNLSGVLRNLGSGRCKVACFS
jgi:hypothetical protein